MSDHDHWFYDLDSTKNQGLIVNAEGFTVIELRSYWADLESLMANICREHNRQHQSFSP